MDVMHFGFREFWGAWKWLGDGGERRHELTVVLMAAISAIKFVLALSILLILLPMKSL
jgi:hypothetical protein